MYCLKQSPRAWYKKLDYFFINFRYRSLPNQLSIYLRKPKSTFVIISVYVDNLLSSESSLKLTKKEVALCLPITDLGSWPTFSDFTIVQSLFDNPNAQYDMLHYVPINTSMTFPGKLPSNDNPRNDWEKSEIQEDPHRQVLGYVRYLVGFIRPNICFTSSLQSCFMATPSPKHWTAGKRLLWYWRNTNDLTLPYSTLHFELAPSTLVHN